MVWRGTMSITTKRGTLRLKLDARAQSLARRSPFVGVVIGNGGTGRYAKARRFAPFNAMVNRSTWAVTIETTDPFDF